MNRPAIIALLFLAAPASAWAASPAVIGDSLGVGVSMASGVKGLAANGVSIRGPRVIEQIKKLPPGTVAYMSLGTNDAVGSVKGLEKSIDAVIAAAARGRIQLVWIGPPCVNKAWDKNARELDLMLRERLAAAKVTYVSMRDAQICSNEFHARDGIHMTMKGYSYMWAKAQSAAAVRVASVESPPALPAVRPVPRILAEDPPPPAPRIVAEDPRPAALPRPAAVPMPVPGPLRVAAATRSSLPAVPAALPIVPVLAETAAEPLPVEWIGAGAFNWFHSGSILRSPH
jgi:lysophospholipase L1-like esterase